MISISVQVQNRRDSHQIELTTNSNVHSIIVPPRSSANGGELLFLALATCYCNDIYREAGKRNIVVRSVQVEVSGTFGDAPGSTAENLSYRATVEAEASQQDIEALMRYTDTVAEIQNTIRLGIPVTLAEIHAIAV